MLILNYYDQLIFQDKRIQLVTGFTANTGGDLLGLKIEYTYDDKGNLQTVTRTGSSPNESPLPNETRLETYGYTEGDTGSGYNLTSYTDPDNHTITYSYYGDGGPAMD